MPTVYGWQTTLASTRLPVKRNEFWQAWAAVHIRWSRGHSTRFTGSLWRVVVGHT